MLSSIQRNEHELCDKTNVESNQIFRRCVLVHIEDGTTSDMPEDEEMENLER